MATIPPQCRSCSFRHKHAGLVNAHVLMKLSEERALLVLGESPRLAEYKAQRLAVSPAWRGLRGIVADIGIDPDYDCVWLHTTKCAAKKWKLPTLDEQQQCAISQLTKWGHVKAHLAARKRFRRGALLCGDAAIFVATGHKLSARKVRGSVLPTLAGGWAVATVGPEFIANFDPDLNAKAQHHFRPLVMQDVNKAIHHCKPTVPRVRHVVSLLDRAEMWQSYQDYVERTGERPLLSLDIEGRDGLPVLVGLCWEPGESWVFNWQGAVDARLLERFFELGTVVAHNAAYDIPELAEAGVAPPEIWVDTINTAALVDPSVPLNLQSQVLTWVNGYVTWKGLVNHDDITEETPENTMYRELWRQVLKAEGIDCGGWDPMDWYVFYNGLDVDSTRRLVDEHKRELGGRWEYYLTLMQPLQSRLIETGERGMPVNANTLADHREKCLARAENALGTLRVVAEAPLRQALTEAQKAVEQLEDARELEQAASATRIKFSQAKELTSARAKLRTRQYALEAGFNADSADQRKKLLYEYLGLPKKHKYNRKTGGRSVTTSDDALQELISQLERKTIKPKRGDREQAIEVCRALIEAKKWMTWARNFCNPPLVEDTQSQEAT